MIFSPSDLHGLGGDLWRNVLHKPEFTKSVWWLALVLGLLMLIGGILTLPLWIWRRVLRR